MEEDQGAVFISQGVERVVWERTELMEISDYGKLRWRRRLVSFFGSLSFVFEEEDESRDEEEKRE